MALEWHLIGNGPNPDWGRVGVVTVDWLDWTGSGPMLCASHPPSTLLVGPNRRLVPRLLSVMVLRLT